MKLLLVEDNERVGRFVKKGLTEAGHTVDHADNGKDGMVHAVSAPYDAIIVQGSIGGPPNPGVSLMRTAFKTALAIVAALGAMGIAILTGADKWLEARVNNWLPDGWLSLTTLF